MIDDRYFAVTSRADLARIDATTEEEIAGYEREDGTTGLDWREASPVWRPAVPDVRAIRKKLNMTREAFANNFGLDLRAVEAWEQHRREPDRAARILLAVIADAPEVVRNAVAHLAA